MVVVSRLWWVYEQLQSGRPARVAVTSSVSGMNMHIVLHQRVPGHLTALNELAMQVVWDTIYHVDSYVVVDHGHRHSSGSSHISFNVRPLHLRRAHSAPGGPGPGDSDDSDGGDDADLSSRRRGRGPRPVPDAAGSSEAAVPSASATGFSGPPAKVPRRHSSSRDASPLALPKLSALPSIPAFPELHLPWTNHYVNYRLPEPLISAVEDFWPGCGPLPFEAAFPSGFDADEFDKSGYDRDGYDKEGFDHHGYDRNGCDRGGCDHNGYDKDGVDHNGYDRDGYDRDGYDHNGYDRSGYDSHGFDQNGYDCSGYNLRGFDRLGYDKDGYNTSGFNLHGFD
ncbi:unnamed protein product, partial [Prorocentrum cordatum]